MPVRPMAVEGMAGVKGRHRGARVELASQQCRAAHRSTIVASREPPSTASHADGTIHVAEPTPSAVKLAPRLADRTGTRTFQWYRLRRDAGPSRPAMEPAGCEDRSQGHPILVNCRIAGLVCPRGMATEKAGTMAEQSIRVMCPNLTCRRILTVPFTARGKIVRCPGCNKNVRVPATSTTGSGGGGSSAATQDSATASD